MTYMYMYINLSTRRLSDFTQSLGLTRPKALRDEKSRALLRSRSSCPAANTQVKSTHWQLLPPQGDQIRSSNVEHVGFMDFAGTILSREFLILQGG